MPIVLPIFDIDGTLTHTTGVDDEAFVGAVQSVLRCEVIERDWGKYVHSTDEGLTLEIAQRELGRDPTLDEFELVRETFLATLRKRIGDAPERCQPAAGVRAVLDALRVLGASQSPVVTIDHADGDPPRFASHGFAIASGAWPGSARIKLDASGLGLDDVPHCFSIAHENRQPLRREEIIQTAARRFLERANPDRPIHAKDLRVVYIGDGVWDARAARALGIGFLGVRLDGKSARLRAEAPDAPIITDYLDATSVLSLIPALAKPINL